MSITPLSTALDNINKLKTKEEQIAALRNLAFKPALLSFFDATFNPALKFRLPEGKPPYKPFPGPDAGGQLYNALRHWHIYFEGNAPNLTRMMVEEKFINMLESLDKNDAELVLYIKDNRKLPQAKLTKKLIVEAFPEATGRWD